MLRFKSIFSRIIFLHAIAVILTAIVMPSALYLLLDSEVSELHQSAMLKQAERLAGYLVPNSDGKLTFNLPAGLQSQYSRDYGRYSYAVLDGDRHVLFSSLKDGAAVFGADTRSSEIVPMTINEGDSEISGVSLPKTIGGRDLWIQVAEDLSHRDVLTDDVVADFIRRVGWVTLPVLVLLLTTDILIFRRAARPLLQASEKALAITPKRLDVRLPVERIPIEILPLVSAVNQALDRLEHGFNVQREFTADAAHELRTPIAILRNHAEAITDPHVAHLLRQDVEGMTRIIGQLLDIAELDALTIDPSEEADLEAICIRVIEGLAPLALAEGKSIAFNGIDKPRVKGNEEILYRAVRNLVENAIGQTAPSTTVEVVLEKGEVSVLDEGPGIKDEERELIFRRFWRRDRRRTGSAGLGLAIVQRIAETHGATISVNNRPSGGARFSLSFADARA